MKETLAINGRKAPLNKRGLGKIELSEFSLRRERKAGGIRNMAALSERLEGGTAGHPDLNESGEFPPLC